MSVIDFFRRIFHREKTGTQETNITTTYFVLHTDFPISEDQQREIGELVKEFFTIKYIGNTDSQEDQRCNRSDN